MVNINNLKAGVKKLAVVSSSAVLMTLSVNASAMAANFYNLTDLGTLPGGNFSIANGINDVGQVVGYSTIGGNGARAFLWSANTGMTDLGFLPNIPVNYGDDDEYDISSVSFIYQSAAYDINNLGQVVGTSSVDFDYDTCCFNCCFFNRAAPRVFFWTNDTGVLPVEIENDYYGDWPKAINNLGQVVGASGRLPTTSFLWSLESLQIGLFSYPNDINDAGQVVGIVETSPDGAFVWSSSDGRTLITPPLDEDDDYYDFPSEAVAINNLSQVVGRLSNSVDGNIGFLWSKDTGIINIGSGVRPTDINDKTQVVGWGGYFWSEKTGRLDLNNLIDPNLGLSIERANAINNKGQIVGSGRNQNGELRAFLLTPITVSKTVPEPNTIGGILLVGMGLTYLRRRQRQL